MSFITEVWSIIEQIFHRPAYDQDPKTLPMNMPPEPPTPIILNPDYIDPNWENEVRAHHNVRALCDLCGLTFDEKLEMTATVAGESDFDIHAKNYNYAFHADGTKYIASTDTGLCQWNDKYHGKEISAHDAEFDPEKAVRLMAAYWIRARLDPRIKDQWIAHKNDRYKLFLGKV